MRPRPQHNCLQTEIRFRFKYSYGERRCEDTDKSNYGVYSFNKAIVTMRATAAAAVFLGARLRLTAFEHTEDFTVPCGRVDISSVVRICGFYSNRDITVQSAAEHASFVCHTMRAH